MERNRKNFFIIKLFFLLLLALFFFANFFVPENTSCFIKMNFETHCDFTQK